MNSSFAYFVSKGQIWYFLYAILISIFANSSSLKWWRMGLVMMTLLISIYPLSVHIFICVMQKRCTIQHHKYEFMFVFSVRTKNNEKHYSLQVHFISLLIRLNKMIMIRIEMQQYIFHWNSILILGILLCYYLCHLQIIIV